MVKGLARVIVRGRCVVLGADVSNSLVRVRAWKALPFEVGPNCRLSAKLGRGGKMWWADPHHAGGCIWKGIAGKVLAALENKTRVVVVILGDSDTGKSTLCTYLANIALGKGIAPCIIDGDIGQGDISPPTAIGAAVITQQIVDLRDATPSFFGFIGSISPAGIEQHINNTIQSLCQKTRGLARLVIINTDGYVRDAGIIYKRMLADAIQPDIIVHLGSNPPLESELASGIWLLQSARSSEQAVKSRIERKWRRNDQFLRFAGKADFRANLAEITFRYLGTSYSASDLISAQTLECENLRDVFVGLGSHTDVSGFGVIKNVDRRVIDLVTDSDVFDTIYLSNIRLTGHGAEEFTLGMPGQISRES